MPSKRRKKMRQEKRKKKGGESFPSAKTGSRGSSLKAIGTLIARLSNRNGDGYKNVT